MECRKERGGAAGVGRRRGLAMAARSPAQKLYGTKAIPQESSTHRIVSAFTVSAPVCAGRTARRAAMTKRGFSAGWCVTSLRDKGAAHACKVSLRVAWVRRG
jgi:hypothetical protein